MIVCVFWILFYHTTLLDIVLSHNTLTLHSLNIFIYRRVDRAPSNTNLVLASESIKVGPLHFYHIACKQTLWEALAPRELACRQGITPKDERKGKPGDTPYSCLYGEATSEGVHVSVKNGI